jgi:hypothetical protein
VYLYPHSHWKPEIFPPLREMGFHLWLEHCAVFLWICHSAFASSKVIDTLRFAEVAYHVRYAAKDIQNVGRMIISMSIMFFALCTHVLRTYNGSICRHILKLRILRLKI